MKNGLGRVSGAVFAGMLLAAAQGARADASADAVFTDEVRVGHVLPDAAVPDVVAMPDGLSLKGVLSVGGGASLLDGIRYLQPQGDVPMGSFTNMGGACTNVPAWWVTRGVLGPQEANDFAAAVQGQVKWIALQAAADFEEWLAPVGGAGEGVDGLIGTFSMTNNAVPLTLGQLKNTAKPFYDRLSEVGIATNYPWSGMPDDAALANVGQVKMLFSFDLGRDSDGDGVPDLSDPFPLDAAASIDTDEDGLPDFLVPGKTSTLSEDNDDDGDGLTDGEETLLGTRTDKADTDGDTIWDGLEVDVTHTDPILPDSDFDKLPDDLEILVDFDPHDSTGYHYPSSWSDYSNGLLDYLVIGTDADQLAQYMASSSWFMNPWLADTDGDDLSDFDELMIYNTNPTVSDTDGDMVNDGLEIAARFDPLTQEYDRMFQDSNGDGVCDWFNLINGENPETTLPDTNYYVGETVPGIEAWSLFSGVYIPLPPTSFPGIPLVSRTVSVCKTGPWQLFYLAGSPDGTAIVCGQELEISCEVDGVPVLSRASNSLGIMPIFFGNKTNVVVTMRIYGPAGDVCHSLGFSGVHLLRWSPNISINGLSTNQVARVTIGDESYVVVPPEPEGTQAVEYQLDLSSRPRCSSNITPLTEEERWELNATPAIFSSYLSNVLVPMSENGLGQLIAFGPTVATVKAANAGNPLHIVFIKPEVTRSGAGFLEKPLGILSGGWPLVTKEQRSSWKDTFAAAGESRGTITVTTGVEGFNLPPGLLNISIGGVPGASADIPVPSVASGIEMLAAPPETDPPCDSCDECGDGYTSICIMAGCTPVHDECDDDPDDEQGSGDGSPETEPCSQGCTDCDDMCSCAATGSFKFRASLGHTENGTAAGAVWAAIDTPQPVTTEMFHVLAAPNVLSFVNGQTVTVTSHDRTAVLEPVSGGVRLTVTSAGSQTLRSRWTITNSSANAIRVVKEDSTENSDETFTYLAGSGVWQKADNLRGVTETLNTVTSPDGQSKTESRQVTETGTGLVISETVTTRTIIGDEARITYQSEKGPSGTTESRYSYWTDATNKRRLGKLKLRSGNASDWQYTYVDDQGRPVLTAAPLDGSLPGNIAYSEPSSEVQLANLGYQCLATVYGYAPDVAKGDSGHVADSDKPREVAVYAVYMWGNPILVSLTRHVYTRSQTPSQDPETGYPTLSEKTFRYADPSDTVSASGCQETELVTFAGSEAGDDLPAVLWGLPLYELTADGVENSYSYTFGDYDPELVSFHGNASGSCLQTVMTTSESLEAEVSVSDPVRGVTFLRETYYMSPDGNVRTAWEATEHDADGHPLVTLYSDGTSVLNDYNGSCGCRLTATVGRDGIRTENWSAPANPLWSATAVLTEVPGVYDVTESFKDSVGRVTNTVRCVWNGSWLQGGSRASSPAPLSTPTVYPYVGGQYTVTPAGLTTESVSRQTETAVTNVSNSSGVMTTDWRVRGGGTVAVKEWDDKWTRESRSTAYETGGLRVETVVTESSDYPSVIKSVTVSDALGRTLSVSTPAFGGGWLVTSSVYDGATSRVLRRTQSGSADTLYAYNEFGKLSVSALDANGNGNIDLGGPDRVTASLESYEEDASHVWWKVSASTLYPEAGSAVPVTNAMSRTRLTGLGVPFHRLVDDWNGVSEAGVLTVTVQSISSAFLVDIGSCIEFFTPGNVFPFQMTFPDYVPGQPYQFGSYEEYSAGLPWYNVTSDGSVYFADCQEGKIFRIVWDGYSYLLDLTDSSGGQTVTDDTAVWGGVPFAAVITAAQETIDANAATTRVYTVVDADSASTWTITETPGCERPSLQKTVAGRLSMSVSPTSKTEHFTYDGLGRQTAHTDGRGNIQVTLYNNVGQVSVTAGYLGDLVSIPQLTAGSALLTNRNTYVCDARDRITAVTGPLGNTVHSAYDGAGNVIAQWGATYPVAYAYDTAGRKTALATTRDANLSSANLFTLLPAGVALSDTAHASYPAVLDTTRWTYHPATGLLLSKTYADGSGPSYTYTAEGRPATRTWARNVVTTYGYDSLGLLTTVDYSDDTPDVTYAYDRLGRRLSAVSSVSSVSYTYSGLDLVTETQNGELLSRTNDECGRPHSLSVSQFGFMDAFRSEYSYDPATGRQSGVQSESRNYSLVTPLSASQAFDYTYLEGSDVAQSTVGWSLNGSGQWEPKLSTTRLYEAERDLVTEVVNSWGGSPAPISWHAYQNDALGRRTDRQDVGQIVTQNHFVYNDKSEVAIAIMDNEFYSYDYDPIGNRRAAQVNGAATDYVPNKLNQYTGITGNLVSSPTYDADGNMLTCTLPTGDWTFTWDAENRLVSAVNGAVGVRNTYDHQSRRIRKEVFDFDAGASEYVLRTDRVFVYDGWNLVSELVWTPAEQKWQRLLYTWGRDLSGTPQGAGGVGGLLAVTVFSEDAVAGCSGETYVPTYDANGNITAYYDLAGTVAARYDYDAVGNTVSGSVGAGVDLPFRFSTKYLDEETGLYDYGYRFYSPSQGRFINRDPIEERGGLNLYGFVGNDPVSGIDALGLFGSGQTKAGGDWIWVYRSVGDPHPKTHTRRTERVRVYVPQGHSDFPEYAEFDYVKQDTGWTCPLWNPASHFQPMEDTENELKRIYTTCNKNRFERAMHKGQDFFSHYENFYRWDPFNFKEKDWGFGHGPDSVIGINPDADVEAWARANDWTALQLIEWHKNCVQCGGVWRHR